MDIGHDLLKDARGANLCSNLIRIEFPWIKYLARTWENIIREPLGCLKKVFKSSFMISFHIGVLS